MSCTVQAAIASTHHLPTLCPHPQGDIRSLMDDVAALKPTLFVGVPRVFERVYNGVMDKVGRCSGREGGEGVWVLVKVPASYVLTGSTCKYMQYMQYMQ